VEGIWSTKPEWAFVFEYKDLGIDLSTSTIIVDKNELDIEQVTTETDVKPGRPSKLVPPQEYEQQTLGDKF